MKEPKRKPAKTKEVAAQRASAPIGSISRWYDRTAKTVLNYPLLLLVVACQFITVAISWPVWNVREAPVLLPLVPMPEISFGIPLLMTLLAATIWPRVSVVAQGVVLLIAILADQHRLQPQVISLAILMAGCLQTNLAFLARWYLIAMWLWAGLHKLLSPEWFGFQSWWFLDQCGIDADVWHWPFAIMVATCETVLALVAIFRPKLAAWPAVLLHLGVLVLLSPLVRNFNASVWPWNLATAAAAYWLLRTELSEATLPSWRWLSRGATAALLLAPALFYVDLVNPHLAFVLYSGNMPRAIHVREDNYSHLDGWTGLTVPFPDSPQLFLHHFRLTAKPGERLHILDPRPGMSNRFIVMQNDGTPLELAQDEYRHINNDPKRKLEKLVRPLELEDVQLVWSLRQAGYQLTPDDFTMIDVAEFDADTNRDSLNVQPQGTVPHREVAGLPNLRELHWHGLQLDEHLLAAVCGLPRLEILELSRCHLPEETFERLTNVKSLRWLQIESSNLPHRGFNAFVNRPQVEVLRLRRTDFDDVLLAQIQPTSQLTWLDLGYTRVTSSGVRTMPVLSNCDWLDLQGTAIDESALDHLPDWPKLLVLDLRHTELSDRAIPALSRLNRLERLLLQGTKLSAAGQAQLQRALPHVAIED